MNSALVPQENTPDQSMQETNASLKDRLTNITLERQEKLKAEICKTIDGMFFIYQSITSLTHTIEKSTLIYHKSLCPRSVWITVGNGISDQRVHSIAVREKGSGTRECQAQGFLHGPVQHQREPTQPAATTPACRTQSAPTIA